MTLNHGPVTSSGKSAPGPDPRIRHRIQIGMFRSIRVDHTNCLQLAIKTHSFTTGVKGVNFYVRHTVLRSDRGSEFINASVLDVCGHHGCVPEYSCPRQLEKYQNGVVERRIKEIGRMGRAMMFTAEPPDLTNAYCILQAVDILNMLPSTANPADPLSNVTGFSPHLLYYNSPLVQLYAFGSFCTVHLDDDHIDSSHPNVRAASCIYLCRAHHCHRQGHIVWEYRVN
jgi:hypothetical protein